MGGPSEGFEWIYKQLREIFKLVVDFVVNRKNPLDDLVKRVDIIFSVVDDFRQAYSYRIKFFSDDYNRFSGKDDYPPPISNNAEAVVPGFSKFESRSLVDKPEAEAVNEDVDDFFLMFEEENSGEILDSTPILVSQ
jgi:hypothetical protein